VPTDENLMIARHTVALLAVRGSRALAKGQLRRTRARGFAAHRTTYCVICSEAGLPLSKIRIST
jgi:hypothetical protein